MTSVATKPAGHDLEAREALPERTRVLVVDDHPAVRAGVRELLADTADFEMVAAVSSAEAGLEAVARDPIDVVVTDYQLGGRSGLWLSRKLKRLPQPPAVLIYSACTGLTFLSSTYWDFALFRFLTGLGVGGVFGLAVALIAESLPEIAVAESE